MPRGMTKELRPLERIAKQQGWTVAITRSGHLRWTSPTGATVASSLTPSDVRALYKITRDLANAGLQLPDDAGRMPEQREQSLTEMVADAPHEILDAVRESDPSDVVALQMRDRHRERVFRALTDTADAAEAEEAGQHTNDIERVEGTVAHIGTTATWSGLDMSVVTHASQSVFDRLRTWIASNRDKVEGTSKNTYGLRHHMRRPIKGTVTSVIADLGITDDIKINLYCQAVYRVMQDTTSGNPALIKLESHIPGSRDALWSVADAWTAPESIVPMFLSRRGTAMTETSAERRVTPEEANDDGSKNGPVLAEQTDLNKTSPHWQPTPNDPERPWCCVECGDRFGTTAALGGHIANHHSRLTKVPPGTADEIEAAVERTIRRMFGVDKSDAEVEALRVEVEALRASADEWAVEATNAQAERDEAVAAIRLLLTDYINPKVVEGAIDTAKYLDGAS